MRPLDPGAPGLGTRRLVALASDRGRAAGVTDLYLYDLDAGGLIPLAGLNGVASVERDPSLAADGRWLVFASDRGTPGAFDLFGYDLEQRVRVPLGAVNTAAAEEDPALAADGRHLAFVRRVGALRRVRLARGMPPDSLVATPGLDGPAGSSDSAPAPDSTARRIAFVTDRAGSSDVLVWDRDSAAVLALPDLAGPSEEVDPAITPDGRYVAFASDRGGAGFRILLYDLAARSFVALPGLAADGEDRAPSLGRDLENVAFQSTRSFGTARRDVWVWERAASRARSTPGLASAGDDLTPWLRGR